MAHLGFPSLFRLAGQLLKPWINVHFWFSKVNLSFPVQCPASNMTSKITCAIKQDKSPSHFSLVCFLGSPQPREPVHKCHNESHKGYLEAKFAEQAANRWDLESLWDVWSVQFRCNCPSCISTIPMLTTSWKPECWWHLSQWSFRRVFCPPA